MGLYKLDSIFEPHRIAVIGASDKKGSVGSTLMDNLLDGGFQGTVVPVNPKIVTALSPYCEATGNQEGGWHCAP